MTDVILILSLAPETFVLDRFWVRYYRLMALDVAINGQGYNVDENE